MDGLEAVDALSSHPVDTSHRQKDVFFRLPERDSFLGIMFHAIVFGYTRLSLNDQAQYKTELFVSPKAVF